jgi:hypothetical protein
VVNEENPFDLVKHILHIADKLHSERFGVLSEGQAHCFNAIERATREYRDVLVYADDVYSENARRFLSYETREMLATVLGFAEMLIDGEYGQLNTGQIQQLYLMRAESKRLLIWLNELFDQSGQTSGAQI